MARGGSLKATGTAAPAIKLSVRVSGLDKTSDEFKRIRREVNAKARDVMQDVGKVEVLPYVVSAMRAEVGSRWATSLRINRDRAGVFVGSTQRGQLNRALGWLDFGGKRRRDTEARVGPKTIVRTVNARRSRIDDAILRKFAKVFDPLEHTP